MNARIPSQQNLIHPLPTASGVCVLIPDFLSPTECLAYLRLAEQIGFNSAESDYPPSYRNNERLVIDASNLAGELYQRLRERLPQQALEESWVGLNERLRFCRYGANQAFFKHQDGIHYRGDDVESRLTFLLYLSKNGSFEGGETIFYQGGPNEGNDEVARIQPRQGSLLIFDHALWHAGDVVTSGNKHILRSDILVRRPALSLPEPASSEPFQPAHRGYVWSLAQLGESIASGGRDASIRFWSHAGRPLGQLLGHQQSVLGLAAMRKHHLASVSRDRSLRIWDVPAQRCVAVTHAHDSAVLAVLATDDGKLLTAGADHRLRRWHWDGQALQAAAEWCMADGLAHSGWVWAIAEHGGRVFSASEDGLVRLWDAASGCCLRTLHADRPLHSLAVSPDGRHVVAGDFRGRVWCWYLMLHSDAPTFSWQAHQADVRRLRFLSPQRLASGAEDNHLRLWDFPSRTLRTEFRRDNFVTDMLALGADTLLSSAYDGGIARHPLSH